MNGRKGMDMVQTQRPRPKLSIRNKSSIRLDIDVREMLKKLGAKGVSYSDIIRRLLSYQ